MEQLKQQILALLEVFQGRPYVQALIIGAAALIVAYVVAAMTKTICHKLATKTKMQLDNEIAEILHSPLFYTVFLIGVSVALLIAPFSEGITSAGASIVKTLYVLIWTTFAVRLARLLLRASVRNQIKSGLVNIQTLPLFENLVFILAIGVAVYLAFNAWGVNMTAWLASAGVVGIAVGFASKDTLSNLISGIFILADAPYKIGDYVVLDTGERGEVKAIGIRSTRLLTRDDVELTIPNAVMGNSKIVNQSGGPYKKFRIRIPVGVAYGSDIDQVRALLMRVAENNAGVCHVPEPRVRFRQFGASSLDFELLCWVNDPSQRGLVTDEVLSEIYKLFNQNDVEIPFSKQDVYIKELPKAE